MRKGEEYILAFPVFVVLQPPHEYLGLRLGELHALALFTDRPAAEEWLPPGGYLEMFPNLGALLEHLRGVQRQTHVVLNPKKGKLASCAKVSEFIDWLERDNPEYAGPKFFHPFPNLSPFQCAELREKIRAMVQDQRMTIGQAAAALKIEERRRCGCWRTDSPVCRDYSPAQRPRALESSADVVMRPTTSTRD